MRGHKLIAIEVIYKKAGVKILRLQIANNLLI